MTNKSIGTSSDKGKRPSNRTVPSIVIAVILLAAILLAWDVWNRHQRLIDCGDGSRYTIDMRDFTTQYSTYSVQLETNIEGNKFSLKLDPVQLEKLSEAMQSANEFRKGLIAGFNSCGITKAQYARIQTRFQALDGLARQINTLGTQSSSSGQSETKLRNLINSYADLAQKLGEK